MHFIKSGAWLDELLLDDCPGMDLTVEMLGIDDRPGFMIFSPKSDCVVSGAEEAALLLERCGLAVTRHVRNGDRAGAGQPLLEARGDAAGLHRGWKISQTLMEYMSGIATRAARMADAARAVSPRVRVAVTRKNFPGAKRLCLEAAVSGGAVVHRLNLSDSVLVSISTASFSTTRAQMPRTPCGPSPGAFRNSAPPCRKKSSAPRWTAGRRPAAGPGGHRHRAVRKVSLLPSGRNRARAARGKAGHPCSGGGRHQRGQRGGLRRLRRG